MVSWVKLGLTIIVTECGAIVNDLLWKNAGFIIPIICYLTEKLMKTYNDCLPCFIRQALAAGRMATDDEDKIRLLIEEVGCMIKELPKDSTPPFAGDLIYKKLREVTGVYDTYEEIKTKSINDVLELYPDLERMIDESDNRLLTAIRLAIAGNVIDCGVEKKFNIVEDVKTIVKQDFGIFHFEEFVEELDKAKSILYIGDNAGESVFDKLLIKELGKPVTYVVREIPVINDLTIKEAIESGLDEVSTIISSGCTAPGTILELCNPDFVELFEKADMVISKGQGNYEGLSSSERKVFFLLKAKCKVIANNLNVEENDIVLK
jgi:hypothetical protein